MYLLSSTEIPDSSQQNYVRMTTNSQIKYQNLQTKHTARRSFQNRVDTLYLNPSTGSSLLSGEETGLLHTLSINACLHTI